MAKRKVRTKFTKAQVESIIKNGIRACNGKGPDTYGFAKVFWGAVAYSLFSSIHTAFLAKSNHGRDELGFSWVDLTPKYKAYGRTDARKGIPLPGPKYRPTLNRSQDRAWRGVFARIMGRTDNNKMAAGTAWNFVKDYLNAKPLIDLTRDRKVPLLQKTKRLVNSLKPAPLQSDGSYRPINRDQVWRVRQGQLTLGTEVPYADYVDKKRKLWPSNISFWMNRAAQKGHEAVTEHLAKVVERGF